jgi:hypothetical protein
MDRARKRYHGMFESRIREIHPQLSLKFLIDLKRDLPQTATGPGYKEVEPIATRMKPAQLLERLERSRQDFRNGR